ncbi:MAG: hypothetical protein CVU03_09080 [Bacteroidetes bacterium HGW-Bacteroidetes-2]|jgi:tetratricopeptide (TPR) repeat protein|nr:MAG: hypothetical protein CVU03_09080 [Bacteroidetes bacterium HGW-Bacteroidetes-2]
MAFFKIIYISLFVFFLSLVQEKSSYKQNHPLTPEGEIENYLNKSIHFVKIDLDSALYYANKSHKLLEDFPSGSKKFNLYKNLGTIYLERGNYTTSMEYFFEAKDIAASALLLEPKNQDYMENQLDILIQLGVAYIYQSNYDEAIIYFNDAMLYLDENKIEDQKVVSSIKIKIYNNTAVVFLQKQEFDKALDYYKKARHINAEIGNQTTEATLANNIGICYLEKKDYDLSLFFFEQSLKIREELGDKRGVAQCYNNIGKNHALTNNYAKAKEYFEKALQLGREIGNTESIINSLQSLTTLFEKTQNYQEAYETSREWTQLKDSLFNRETVKRIAQIEMNHKFEAQKELYQLELKRREVEKDKAKLTYLTIGGSLVFLLSIAVLLIFLQKSKLKNMRLFKEKLELKHLNTTLEKEKLKKELDFKNRELTTKMMYLLKKNELMQTLSNKLSTLKKTAISANQKAIQEMVVEINSKKDKDVWAEFETHFTAVHPDFYAILNEQFPNLTPNERKLCAFLKLNMNSKEISAITFQSINSITVSRTRLRKKLNIIGDDTSLSNFLNNI